MDKTTFSSYTQFFDCRNLRFFLQNNGHASQNMRNQPDLTTTGQPKNQNLQRPLRQGNSVRPASPQSAHTIKIGFGEKLINLTLTSPKGEPKFACHTTRSVCLRKLFAMADKSIKITPNRSRNCCSKSAHNIFIDSCWRFPFRRETNRSDQYRLLAKKRALRHIPIRP